jgi:vacuolar-type H+-ATPase subunit F/Vma7
MVEPVGDRVSWRVLNDAISSERYREVILVSEALHEQQIADIAESVANQSASKRIVLIAGPSSSGKNDIFKTIEHSASGTGADAISG